MQILSEMHLDMLYTQQVPNPHGEYIQKSWICKDKQHP